MKQIKKENAKATFRHKADGRTYDCVLDLETGNATFFRRLDAERWIQVGPEVIPLDFYMAITSKQGQIKKG